MQNIWKTLESASKWKTLESPSKWLVQVIRNVFMCVVLRYAPILSNSNAYTSSRPMPTCSWKISIGFLMQPPRRRTQNREIFSFFWQSRDQFIMVNLKVFFFCGAWYLSEIKIKLNPLLSCAIHFLCLSSFINLPIQSHPEQSLKILSTFPTGPWRHSEKRSGSAWERRL